MKLESKTLLISLTCLLLVGGSISLYRFMVLNGTAIQQGKELVDSNQQELLKLKRSVDEFNAIAQNLSDDPQLNTSYFAETMTYESQFDRKGVEKIDEVLRTVYREKGFFELKRLTIKHFVATAGKKEPPPIKFLIEGDKHVVKQ